MEDGNLVCGYHGWTFDEEGRCIKLPQVIFETCTCLHCLNTWMVSRNRLQMPAQPT